MKALLTIVGALMLAAQAGLPPPVQPAFVVAVQAGQDTTATVTATWKRPGTPGSWALRYPWRSDATYMLEGNTQTWQTSDTATTEMVVFQAPRFWEDVVATFCVKSAYQNRESGERCAEYVIPARPLPPPDSLEITVTLVSAGAYDGGYFVTLRWDSVAGADFFGRVYAKPESKWRRLS